MTFVLSTLTQTKYVPAVIPGTVTDVLKLRDSPAGIAGVSTSPSETSLELVVVCEVVIRRRVLLATALPIPWFLTAKDTLTASPEVKELGVTTTLNGTKSGLGKGEP